MKFHARLIFFGYFHLSAGTGGRCHGAVRGVFLFHFIHFYSLVISRVSSCDDESTSLFSFILILLFLLLFLCYTWPTRGRLFHMQTRRTHYTAFRFLCPKQEWLSAEYSEKAVYSSEKHLTRHCHACVFEVLCRFDQMRWRQRLPTLVALT